MNSYEIQELLKQQKHFFKRQQTKSYEYRYQQLETLEQAIKQYESKILEALKIDLGKSNTEAYLTEIGFTLSSIRYVKKHLKSWMKRERVKSPVHLFRSDSYIIREPYGVVYIIGPFNYPFQLLIEPLIGAMCAGNTAILKPSELTPTVSTVIRQMIDEFFEKDYIAVIEGDRKVNQMLLEQHFDYIFFTGSTRVAKIVMDKASQHLTPVTLELGGQSPAIVTSSTDIRHACRQIAYGKFTNAGQTCVAPNHCYVERTVYQQFVDEMKQTLEQFYTKEPHQSRDYGRLVNVDHTNRLAALLKGSDGEIIHGGEISIDERFISPTMVRIEENDLLMSEELFGPILPIMVFDEVGEVVNSIQSMDPPLALYVFTEDVALKDELFHTIRFGGGMHNGTLLHLSNIELPFGGIGSSGMGNYHGKYSFETFSHQKSIVELKQNTMLKMMYPPYRFVKRKVLKKFI